jgi:hypothetical protein
MKIQAASDLPDTSVVTRQAAASSTNEAGITLRIIVRLLTKVSLTTTLLLNTGSYNRRDPRSDLWLKLHESADSD